MRLDVGDRPANEPRDGNAVPSTRSEVHHRGLEAVARGEPLVLARQDAVVRGDLLACLVALAELLHERLAVGGDGNRVFDPRDAVADPDLDRAEPGMKTDVPPDVGVVRDAARALELSNHLRVVRVVAEARGRARARERREDHLPARCEPGRLAAPERRARGEGEQRRQLGEEPVHDLDRLLGIVDSDVDVHAEDQLATGDVLHLVDERPVSILRRDPLPLEEAKGVRAGRSDP